MSRRKLQIGVVVVMVVLLYCTGKIMVADATEAKNDSNVTLLQNMGTKGNGIDEVDIAEESGDKAEDEVSDEAKTEDQVGDEVSDVERTEDQVEDEVSDVERTEDQVEDEVSDTGDTVEKTEDEVSGETGNENEEGKPDTEVEEETGEDPAEHEQGITSVSGAKTKEMRAVWIYFNELNKKAASYDKWKRYIDGTFDTCKAKKMNTVILQVRPCADAMYPSQYYPWSKYATGKAGRNPGFDPLKYAVSAAHKRGLMIQAWVNPYRITLSSTKISSLPAGSVARKWATSSKKSEKRNVLKVNGALYFNPASAEVQNLVANGVREIVKNYNVDGIHMDDYFYPSLGTENFKKFDYSEYKTYVKKCKKSGESSKSLVNWRRNNVNKMVKKVYAAVKKVDKNCVFGISPAGNLENLYSSTKYYSDVKAWMNSTEYIDYICPQIYWSFTQKTAPYKKMLKEWAAIPRKSKVQLYIGLAGYRAGISLKEAKAVSDTGWAKSNTILKRQVTYARSTKKVSGFCVFSYGTFTRKSAAKEVKNLLSVLK